MMKKCTKRLLCALLAIGLLSSGFGISAFAESGTVLYVATDGSDDNAGTIDAPFQTVEKARDVIRTLKEEEGFSGATVYIRGGIYSRSETFLLEREDSGTEEHPIVYRNYPGEEVIFTNGTRLLKSDFKQVTDNDLTERIPRTAKSKIRQVDLKKYGIDSVGNAQPSGYGVGVNEPIEVFADGNAMHLARYPNEGFIETGEVVQDGDRNGTAIFHYTDDQPNTWENADDAFVFGYFNMQWADNGCRITELDTSEKTITLKPGPAYGVKANRRYYYYNVIEELDAPGEYYIDRDNAVLYFYPPEDFSSDYIEVSAGKKSMLNISGSNLTVRGINFELGLGSCFLMSGSNNLILDCTMKKFGNQVGQINGTNNGLVGCEIDEAANGGVSLTGGDRKTLTPGGNYVENCEFHNFSRIRTTYSQAVNITGVGNRISNCKMYDGPHSAIEFKGNDLLIEYNDIFDMVQETDDAGAIYTGRDYTFRGNVLRYNFIHDVVGLGLENGASGIYLDDYMSSAELYGNVLYDVYKAFMIGGGRDHLIHNNIVSDCKISMAFDERNASLTPGGLLALDTFKAMPVDSEIWLEKYPELNAMKEDEEPGLPKGNTIINNVIDASPDFSMVDNVEIYGTVEKNYSVVGDAGFVDKENLNFNLKPDSKIYKELPEFQPIPFDDIGLYNDRVDSYLADSVGLFVGRPNAVVNGEETMVDPENLAVTPLIDSDRTLVPVRFISESLGAEVGWDPDTATVTVDLAGKQITLVIGSDTMTVDGSEVVLDAPAQSIEGRTMIPLRAMVEAVGKQVFWDPRGLILISNEETQFAESDPYVLDQIVRLLKY